MVILYACLSTNLFSYIKYLTKCIFRLRRLNIVIIVSMTFFFNKTLSPSKIKFGRFLVNSPADIRLYVISRRTFDWVTNGKFIWTQFDLLLFHQIDLEMSDLIFANVLLNPESWVTLISDLCDQLSSALPMSAACPCFGFFSVSVHLI